MSAFVLIHGAGDGGWYWHLVEAELRARGHDVVAPDLPADDDALALEDYAGAVVAAVGDRTGLVVVGQSFGGFTAALVAARLPVDALVFVSAMVPAPGEAPRDWWARTGYRPAVDAQAARDGGVTGSDDPYVCYYHDVPRALATQAISKERAHPSAASMASPWPLEALPDVPTRFVLGTEDRFFPAAFMRRVVAERLGVVPDEIAAGHCVALSRPVELANLLEDAGRRQRPRRRLIDHYDDELRRHNQRLRAATGVGPGDRVLDIGCGTGQSTRDAARDAAPGTVLGVDLSEAQLASARRHTAEQGVPNATYEHGDAQVHPFPPASFDVIISRFGTMFFADPLTAFRNLARAARPGARLVMLVWQPRERNQWATAIHHALGAVPPPSRLDAFSLGDPPAVESLLAAAGFTDIAFADVHEPVYYGPDPSAALELVGDMKTIRDVLARLDSAAAQRALTRLRATLAAHHTSDGVQFDSRAWLITARVPGDRHEETGLPAQDLRDHDPTRPAAPAWEPAAEPPGPDSVSPAVVVGGTIAAIALAPFAHVIDLAASVAGLVGWAAGVGDDDDRPPAAVDVTGTQPPVRAADGSVACTRCRRTVPWATMSLNQHGYFCSTCGPSQPTGD